jgi:3-keto-L-gulonate-6-phosphate decarboxylase
MLSKLVPLRDTIEVPSDGGTVTLTLYGLGADAVTFLAQEHGEALGTVYAMAVAGGIDAENVTTVVETLLAETPVLIATVIAFGCREPEAIEQAAQLPLVSQIEAVEKIVRLTFAGGTSAKKLGEIVSRWTGVLSGLLPSASANGSTA